MKKWIALLLMACLLCSMLVGCSKKITSEEAYQIVLDDLGEALAATATSPHIHEATYNNKPCFNIFVTVNGVSLNYVISETGDIIHKGPGEHSH